MALTFNLPSQIVVQTAAQWAVDATVYSNKRILVISDAYYGSTDQRKFKIADGTQTWANLDFMPISQTLAQVLANGNSTNGLSFDSPDSLTYLLVKNNNIDAVVDNNNTVSEINITPNTIVISTTGASIDLSATSVTKNSSEIATESYVDGMVAGLLDDRGSYDASGNVFPSSGGSGTAGAILKGDIWYVSVGGTLGGQSVVAGDSVRALVDSPAQTPSNWSILETNIGYVPENVANKTDTVLGNTTSSTKYLSVKGYYDYLIGMTWLTDSIFGTWINALTAKTTPVDADGVTIKDSADSNKAKFLSFTNLKAFLKTYFDTQYPLTNDSRLSDIRVPKCPLASTTVVSITNITSEQYLTGFLIDGSQLSTSSILKIHSLFVCTNNGNSKNIRFYINDTNDLSGTPTQIGRITASTQVNVFFMRELWFNGALNSWGYHQTINQVASTENTTNANTLNTGTKDFTSGKYLVISVEHTALGDSTALQYIFVENYRQS